MEAKTDATDAPLHRNCSPATDPFVVAAGWAIGAGMGQLVLVPFGIDNWPLCFGLVVGATSQSALYFYRKTGPFVR